MYRYPTEVVVASRNWLLGAVGGGRDCVVIGEVIGLTYTGVSHPSRSAKAPAPTYARTLTLINVPPLSSQKDGMYAQKASCKSRARQRRIRARTAGGFHLTLFYAMQGTSTRDVPALNIRVEHTR